jgi:CheY-like chemotaxis protein
MNLVSNAQQASPTPAPIHVRTGRMRAGRGWLAEAVGAALPEGDLVYVEVQDSGGGMDAATRARVFEPFYSTRTAGRGLGLAVVLGIVRAHHGAIHLDTAPGAGATFRVVLPPAAARVQPARPPRGEPRVATAGEAGEVLVCDDDAGVRDLSAELLARAGFRVHLAERAAECAAVAAARGDALCAALVDLELPDGDAGTVLRALAEQGTRVPVVVATGHSAEQAAQILGDAQPAGFLRKPWTAEALLAAVRDAAAGAGGADRDA